MPDIYDDPELRGNDDFPRQARFDRVGDREIGRITDIDKIRTRFQDAVLKYTLTGPDGETFTLLAGGVNLRGQMLSLKPRVGDVLEVELIEVRNTAGGNTKIYDVQVNPESSAQPIASNVRPMDNGRPPTAPVAETPHLAEDEGDLFDR